jgi:hypothetical protein
MRRVSSILVLFLLLAFGASVAVPSEDVPETAYDESEAPPYETTPLFSTVTSPLFAGTTHAPLSSSRHEVEVRWPFTPPDIRDTNALRAAGTRVLSALLCVLLC